MQNTPLDGLKVVELARILAGPWVGQTLCDLGADVIKVESPEGDDTRTWGRLSLMSKANGRLRISMPAIAANGPLQPIFAPRRAGSSCAVWWRRLTSSSRISSWVGSTNTVWIMKA
ncbi:CoA transferase [Brucella abortus]|uniref:CoA transferase n=1 Tax=Brucella abortus TaxID=235 RepID=UPI00358DA59E